MEIRLLGPLEVTLADRVVPLPRRQQRALVAALALRAGRIVSTDALLHDLWGDDPPASALGSLQNTVSGLRKLLGRDAVVTQAPGYRLSVRAEDVDAHRFERLLAKARSAEPAARATLLREALALWRGPALSDLAAEDFARLAAARLDELYVTAVEERLEAELELGRHADLVAELEQLVALHPLRERLRGLLMLALYRCGRQAEALEVYRAARLALADELGLEPSAELRELERRMLRQDPALAPPAEAQSDEPAPAAAERRLVSVLAATPPGADDPEEHRRRLDETLASVRDVLDRHGGVLERFGPEGLVAVFGAEAPRDDDAMRAVSAARELGLAAGVATGEVVDGAGAVVTRAVALARGAGVTLDDRTQALVGAVRRLDAPLVGRSGELARLRTAFAAARESSRCRVLTLVGEPGIGKTRLARELALLEDERATVLVAHCVAYGGGAAFLPLLEALRTAEPERVLEREADRDLVLARLRTQADGDQSVALGESFWAIRRVLEALAPAVLLLDDVHWAEPPLLDLVAYLAERVHAPLLVLCLSRPELERPPGETLRLDPLTRDESRSVVARTADLGEETRERIVELAEGNPLYAEQLAAFAAEAGEGLPPTLEAVLAGRLGRLDPAERAVLQRAAVVGREFSRSAVDALADGDVVRELLALSRRGLVHPSPHADPSDDGFTFHHVLLRDAAYASLTKADRAALHERHAAWLDRAGAADDAVAGYHLEQAALLRRELGESADELAAAAGARLGAAAMRGWRLMSWRQVPSEISDVSSSSALMERAIALLPEGAARTELLWEYAIALRIQNRSADADAALADVERSAMASRLPAIAARVAAERTHLELLNGELGLDEAVAAFEEALETLRAEHDERGLGRAELVACSVHWLASNHAAAAAAAERAGAHYLEAGFSPAACIGAQAEALFYGATTVEVGSAKCAALLETSPDSLSRANVTAVLGGFRALAGDADDARSLLEEARALYEEIGSRRGLLTVWTPLRVEADFLAGDLDAAAALARDNASALAGERGHASTRALQLAEILLLKGEDEQAVRALAAAERDALPSDVLVQFVRRSLRARLLGRAGDVEAAEPLARAAVAIASQTDALCSRARAHFALAEVLELSGVGSAARAEEAEGHALLRRKGVEGALVGAPSK